MAYVPNALLDALLFIICIIMIVHKNITDSYDFFYVHVFLKSGGSMIIQCSIMLVSGEGVHVLSQSNCMD